MAFSIEGSHNRPGFATRLSELGVSARRGVPADGRRLSMLRLTPTRIRLALIVVLLAGPGLVLLHGQEKKPVPESQ